MPKVNPIFEGEASKLPKSNAESFIARMKLNAIKKMRALKRASSGGSMMAPSLIRRDKDSLLKRRVQ